MKNKLTATKLELPFALYAKKGSTAPRQPYVDAMHGGNILPRATWLLVAVAIVLCLGPTRATQPSIVTGGGTGTRLIARLIEQQNRLAAKTNGDKI
jgi:hypothetical protein